MKAFCRFAAITAVALTAACTDPYTGDSVVRPSGAAIIDSDILASSYHAAERLLKSARQPVDTTQPLLVASLVNLANLRRSSNLGRIIAEQVASRLTQLGYKTREMKYRGNLLIRAGEGEFALSRGLVDISREQKAQAVIAGYYAVAKTVVYLKLELIRAEDAVVIATYDYELPLGPNVIALLQPVEG